MFCLSKYICTAVHPPIELASWSPITNTPAVTCDVGLFQSYHHSMNSEGGEKLPLESSVHSFSSGLLKIKRKGEDLFYLLESVCGITMSAWYLLLHKSLLVEDLMIIATAYEHKPNIA